MHALDMSFEQMPCCGREAGREQPGHSPPTPMIMGLENVASQAKLMLRQRCEREI
jgi:hypothetical protein